MTETSSKSREALQNNVVEAGENCPSMAKIDGNESRFQGQISVENGASAEKAPENGASLHHQAQGNGLWTANLQTLR